MVAIMKHDMKAILGEDFFKDEVKCDYHIPAYMKMNWAIQLDLFMTLAELCDEHGLRYFANSGMLLGAIRQNGFIPWDDDLDVAMPREDYNKLIEYLNHNPHGYYRIVSFDTDKNYTNALPKITLAISYFYYIIIGQIGLEQCLYIRTVFVLRTCCSEYLIYIFIYADKGYSSKYVYCIFQQTHMLL